MNTKQDHLTGNANQLHAAIGGHRPGTNNTLPAEDARTRALAHELLTIIYADQLERDGLSLAARKLRNSETWEQAGDAVRIARLSCTPEGHQESLSHMAAPHAMRVADSADYLQTPSLLTGDIHHYRGEIALSAAHTVEIIAGRYPQPEAAAEDMVRDLLRRATEVTAQD